MKSKYNTSFFTSFFTYFRLKQLSADKKDSEDDTGYLYDFHEKARDILSEYNDTIRGRCAVCLENFA